MTEPSSVRVCGAFLSFCAGDGDAATMISSAAINPRCEILLIEKRYPLLRQVQPQVQPLFPGNVDLHRLPAMHRAFLNALRRLLLGFVGTAIAVLTSINPQDVIGRAR